MESSSSQDWMNVISQRVLGENEVLVLNFMEDFAFKESSFSECKYFMDKVRICKSQFETDIVS